MPDTIPSREPSDRDRRSHLPVGVTAEITVVLAAWAADPDRSSLTWQRMAELAERYATRLERTGVASLGSATGRDAAAFIGAPTRSGGAPSVHTMHLRRSALRAVYRTLHEFGAGDHDPTAFVELPSRWFRVTRPLTTAELAQVRIAAENRRGDPPPGVVVLALAETGASTAELTQLRWSDLDGDTRTVSLPGGRRLLPRRLTLTDWGAPILARARSDPDRLAVSGSRHPPGTQPAIAAMTNRLRHLVRIGELHNVDGIGPRSIRLWAAVSAYEATGRIETAAHVLGIRSLDAAAAAIGI